MLLFLKVPFLCVINLSWYVFCLLVVLVKLSVLATWLARKNSSEEAWPWRRDRLHKAQVEECWWFSWFIVLFHCLVAFLCCPRPLWYISHFYGMIWLFVLKVPLNSNKPNRTIRCAGVGTLLQSVTAERRLSPRRHSQRSAQDGNKSGQQFARCYSGP